MRIKGLTRIFSGLRASYMPGRAPLCPKHRPPQPQNPRHSPWRQALSLVQCCLTGAGLPGRVPINACEASLAMMGDVMVAGSTTMLVPDEVLHPIGKIQPVLIGWNLP